MYDEDTEVEGAEEENEAEREPAKIKFMKGFKKKTGKSSPADWDRASSRGGDSAGSSRSTTPTGGSASRKGRTSLEKTALLKSAAAKSAKGLLLFVEILALVCQSLLLFVIRSAQVYRHFS